MIRTVRFFLLAMLTSISVSLTAQQDAQFTQYMFNGLYYNPAYAGMGDGTELLAIHRSQWLGYEGSLNAGGAPSTQLVSFNKPLTSFPGGIGMYVVNDNLGPVNNLEFTVSFAFQKKFSNGGILSAGINGGMYSMSLNFDELIFVDPADIAAGISGKETQMQPDLGVGFLYRKGNFFGGLSANHLIGASFDFGEDQISNQLSRHYYLNAGYDYEINSRLTITPTILLKSVSLNTYNFDLSVMGKYNDKLWAGLAYRQSEAASAMFGYKVLNDKSLTLAYAFDFVVTGSDSKSGTSHELMLIYNFKSSGGKGKNTGSRIIRTPRYRY